MVIMEVTVWARLAVSSTVFEQCTVGIHWHVIQEGGFSLATEGVL